MYMRSTFVLIPNRFLPKFRPIHLDHSILLPTSAISKIHPLNKWHFLKFTIKEEHCFTVFGGAHRKLYVQNPVEKYPTVFSFCVQVSTLVTASS